MLTVVALRKPVLAPFALSFVIVGGISRSQHRKSTEFPSYHHPPESPDGSPICSCRSMLTPFGCII